MELHARQIEVLAGGRAILSGVSLRLHAGQLCGVIGPSGAGKSTLIRVLLGLTTPARGEVTLAGRPIAEAGPVGYVPQDDALHGALRVRDALDFAAQLRLHGMPDASRQARVRQVILQVGLDGREDVRIQKLSGGQRKRVSVAMELLSQPKLLILDEPTSGLDPGLEAKMMELFAKVARDGRIVLVSTHAMQSIERCDQLMVLARGSLVYFGTPAGALSKWGVSDYNGIFPRLSA
ncbi:MAG: ABC transporter ATP-binding protein [Deltaproteobacteria bacterium]|nr:ABC transporter ATP-binding protein [Deltaproteobacteria bacterium]